MTWLHRFKYVLGLVDKLLGDLAGIYFRLMPALESRDTAVLLELSTEMENTVMETTKATLQNDITAKKLRVAKHELALENLATKITEYEGKKCRCPVGT